MNFEKSSDPYKSLRIGSGRAIKVLWISMGAGARMKDDMVATLFKRWEKYKNRPLGVYPVIKELSNTERFVETDELEGELIEWEGKIYRL